MDDMEILQKMIKSTARLALQEEYGRFRVTLQEAQAPDSIASICNLPADALVIKVDVFKAPDDIFNGHAGECKRADYVIISQDSKTVLYIELKRTKDGLEQIIKQLKGAKCFVHYCQEIGRNFWAKADFLQGYKHRFVSIAHTSIPKRATKVTKTAPCHDAPDKVMKIDWPHNLQYKQLAGA